MDYLSYFNLHLNKGNAESSQHRKRIGNKDKIKPNKIN